MNPIRIDYWRLALVVKDRRRMAVLGSALGGWFVTRPKSLA